ncbi:protein phosphatase 2C domain-containing protein [Nocardia sp. alder85J]|uniref:protein phosphatase 2C domain-containing protein n=1 Tax=Nocardia sp. alder85J TaxID=2862949 RepID=UPI001CD37276|nr:protein phosphatase 2C domain-containing protein [Nocardia sp. alder85J]MCX4094635.1 protein phosphatase 2C domain-containing protein [Nocardia sp. alder85J]
MRIFPKSGRPQTADLDGAPQQPGPADPGDLKVAVVEQDSRPSAWPVVVGRATPLFEPVAVTEEFRRIPYRPDTVLDGWSVGPFTIRAGSMRGHLHRHNGAPRQDDLAITHVLDRRLNVAVADGVSGARQSHIGASTAVRYASQWLADHVADIGADTSTAIDWHTLFRYAAWALIEQSVAVLGVPEADAAQAEQHLATTLVAAVCDPLPDGTLSARLAGVGDSVAWLLTGGRFVPVLGGKQISESGLSSSAVSGLPRVPAEVESARVIVGVDDVLLIGTDGLGDPLGAGTGEVGALFRTMLERRVPSLIEFGHVLDFSRETFDDDRTLVAIWPRPR